MMIKETFHTFSCSSLCRCLVLQQKICVAIDANMFLSGGNFPLTTKPLLEIKIIGVFTVTYEKIVDKEESKHS